MENADAIHADGHFRELLELGGDGGVKNAIVQFHFVFDVLDQVCQLGFIVGKIPRKHWGVRLPLAGIDGHVSMVLFDGHGEAVAAVNGLPLSVHLGQQGGEFSKDQRVSSLADGKGGGWCGGCGVV